MNWVPSGGDLLLVTCFQAILMRFSSCIHCPFICFSQSSRRLSSPSPLKLEDAQHVSSSPSPVPLVVEEKLLDQKVDVEKSADDGKVDISLKSILKKPRHPGSNDLGKGRVKWVDYLGKELVEIREFEPIESRESDDSAYGDQSCGCLVL